MATFSIQEGSLQAMNDTKCSMTVTFTADDARTVTCYHEVEKAVTDTEGINIELQKTADEFESRTA